MKMCDSFDPKRTLTFVFFAVLFCTSATFSQNNVDLDLRVQPLSDTARGGESYSYSFSVINLGTAKATDVILLHESAYHVVSAFSDAGSCRKSKDLKWPPTLLCSLGNIEPGRTVTTSFVVKIRDFGGESETESIAATRAAEFLSRFGGSSEFNSKSPIADSYVSSEETDGNLENNHAKVSAELLPSKNIPPRVQIISPKSETSITKPLNKQIEIPIIIKASDVDGKIVKVIIGDEVALMSRIQFVFENGETKWIIDGKKYTKEELENADEEMAKLFEIRADLTGKDTYSYTARNFIYGKNRIRVEAIDDGGRWSSQTVEFDIKRNATVRIVSPRSNQVFTPNSTITIETTSEINDSTSSQLRIDGTQKRDFYSPATSIPLLRQISKKGTTFKHRYVWKNAPEGIHHLHVSLYDGEIPSYSAERVTVVIAEPRIISISSPKNGQEFEEGKPIVITANAKDIKGKMVNDELVLLVDGKHKSQLFGAWTTEQLPPYKLIPIEEPAYNLLEMKKGIHTIQIIAKPRDFPSDSLILGKSEVVTIKVK